MRNLADCGADKVLGPLGNVWFRSMELENIGDKVGGHTHNFPHVTFLWRGKIEIRKWPEADPDKIEVTEYSAPARILIPNNWVHEITALAKGTRADCIYALRDFDGQVTSQWNGDMTPYV